MKGSSTPNLRWPTSAAYLKNIIMPVIVFNDKYVSINTIPDRRDLNSQGDVKKAYISSDFCL